MRTLASVRRTLVAAALSIAVLGLTAGVAEAKPRDCGTLQRVVNRIMVHHEANVRNMSPLEIQMGREALERVLRAMEAQNCGGY
jgi:hypothetical protein